MSDKAGGRIPAWLNWLNDVRGFITKRNRWQLSYQPSAVVSGRHDIVSKTVTCRLRGRILWVQRKPSPGYFSVIWFNKVGGKTELGFVLVLGPSSEPKLRSGCPPWLVDVCLLSQNVSIWSEFLTETFYCKRRYLWRSGLQFVIRSWCQHAFNGKTVCYVTASILRAEWRNVTEVIIAVSYIQTAREVLNTGNSV